MKVLIAENKEKVRKGLRARLKRWGYDVEEASSGEEALDLLSSESAARLVIVNWGMPGLGGVELCKRIKADTERPYTYVIFLTTRDRLEDMLEAFSVGADDFLSKTVHAKLFRERLNVATRLIRSIPPRSWVRPDIPGYDFIRALGRGANASVWEAQHHETNRRVAVKLIRLDLVSQKVLARFEREIRIAAQLKHPNIAEMYDTYRADQTYAYSMEYVEGENLTGFVRNRRLPPSRALQLMLKICEAINHAHEKGIIHRDLKPLNVLVAKATGEPKVVDFGLAKTVVPEDGGDPGLTMDGYMVGTPMFMSPEQASGNNQAVDQRADVYALGCLAYMLLLGKHPHKLPNDEKRQIAKAIAQGEVRSPTKFDPKMDQELERILLRSLSKLPDDRYQTAGEFADDLRTYLKTM